ncbi:unnamed protein product [Peniophora sp. CBMAI 1063]|nr:unnamed protein product [Peniophora sp. CBMAI 1063]
MSSLTELLAKGLSHAGRRYVAVRGANTANGNFGTVFKCTVEKNGVVLPGYVAVKVTAWGSGILDRKTVLAEKTALETIGPHPGIVPLEDSWTDEKRCELYLVMNFYEHGTLLDYSKTYHVDDAMLSSIHRQCLDIIEHIHGQGFVFLDVKPENMLLESINPPKLILVDFGSARPVDQLRSGKIPATDFYAAPELRNPALRSDADANCDYYAWFMSLYYMMVLQDPSNDGKYCWEVMDPVRHPHKRDLVFELIQGHTTDSFRGFLVSMILCDPGSRKWHMTAHPGPWVKEHLPQPVIPAVPATLSVVQHEHPTEAVWPAPESFQLFGPAKAATATAGPSNSTSVRGPSVKRASVDKCLEKQKAGKSSGVGSTAGKRASCARKKAVKGRAATPGSEPEGGPAQAVLKLRAGRVRKCYKY